MNREGAETFLRLLAEAELRDPQPPQRHAGGATDFPFFSVPARVRRAAWALTAVQALDVETADGILAGVELALALRQQQEPTEPGHTSVAPSQWLSRLTALHQRSWLSSQPPPASGRRGGPERYVPVGLRIAYHDAASGGECALMAYVHTASGARFMATWWSPNRLDLIEQSTLTDDRGGRYDLGFTVWPAPRLTGSLSLRPDPPGDIRWLDLTPPGESAVRVNLAPELAEPPGCARPEVIGIDSSAGEHLLNGVAMQLLVSASRFPRDLRLYLPVRSPGPLADLAVGLGAMVAALEEAGALSPLSPVPGRLAALCASLRIAGHGITAAPAHDLPEPWVSVLSHYRRRKPDPAPAWEGFAALAAPLPELADLRLVLLSLHATDRGSWVNALVIGQLPDNRHAMLSRNMSFPLSVWIRDSSGHWHAAYPSYRHSDDAERMMTFELVPPLARSATWIDVLATGPSAGARARLPLRWQ